MAKKKVRWGLIVGFAGPMLLAAVIMTVRQDFHFRPREEKKISASLLRFQVPEEVSVFVDARIIDASRPFRALPGVYAIRMISQSGKEQVESIQVKPGVNQIIKWQDE